jgi:hypothetical protein
MHLHHPKQSTIIWISHTLLANSALLRRNLRGWQQRLRYGELDVPNPNAVEKYVRHWTYLNSPSNEDDCICIDSVDQCPSYDQRRQSPNDAGLNYGTIFLNNHRTPSPHILYYPNQVNEECSLTRKCWLNPHPLKYQDKIWRTISFSQFAIALVRAFYHGNTHCSSAAIYKVRGVDCCYLQWRWAGFLSKSISTGRGSHGNR